MIESIPILKIEDITIKPDASVLLSGKRRSGKSVIITNLIHLLTN